jgi:hypothetical protein
MTAEAESSIKLAYVHGESETVSATGRVSVGLVWCRETRAKSTKKTRKGLVGPCIYLLLRVGAPVCGEVGAPCFGIEVGACWSSVQCTSWYKGPVYSDPSIGNMCISRSDAFTNITGKAVTLIPANAWC